jgi:hypothetical protein
MFNKLTINFCSVLLLCVSIHAHAHAQNTVVGSVPAEFNVANGNVSYTVPIQVAQGRGGMQPELSLNYNSGGGNGVLGMGWTLSGLSAIHRCPRTIAQDGAAGSINFDADDRYCLDGQRLVPVQGINGAIGTEYRTEIDSYAQIVSYGGTINNPAHWVVKTKAGQVMTYGEGNASLTFPQGTSSWSIREINDTTGNNPISFSYLIDRNNQHLNTIDYIGGRVDFIYDATDRPDTRTRYILGNAVVSAKRIKRIDTYVENIKLQEYLIEYQNQGARQLSRINAIQVCAASDATCFNALRFTWPDAQENLNPYNANMTGAPTGIVGNLAGAPVDISRINFGDFNGDGLTDVYHVYGYANTAMDQIYLSNGDGTYNIINGLRSGISGSIEGASIDISRLKFADFNGDGLTDIYYVRGWASTTVDKIHLSKGDGSYSIIDGIATPVVGNLSGAPIDISRINFGDFNGDGLTDIYFITGWGNTIPDEIHLSKGDGTYEVVSGIASGISGSIAGASIDISRLRFADFNGDGLTDIYYIHGWASTTVDKIHLSNGDGTYTVIDGIASPVNGSHDGAPIDISRVNFGDFNGDGLLDIYHVYGWASTTVDKIYLSRGDGTYDAIDGILSSVGGWAAGAPISISRLKFLDFNGDGLTDIYYIHGWDSTHVDKIHLSNGDGTFHIVDGVATGISGSAAGAPIDISRVNFGDFNGDGLADVYHIYGWGGITADNIVLNNQNRSRLTSISDSNDNDITLTY